MLQSATDAVERVLPPTPQRPSTASALATTSLASWFVVGILFLVKVLT